MSENQKFCERFERKLWGKLWLNCEGKEEERTREKGGKEGAYSRPNKAKLEETRKRSKSSRDSTEILREKV